MDAADERGLAESSGPDGRISLTSRPIDAAATEQKVVDAEYGAVVTFTGAVRAWSRGKRIKHLHYEAYEPLAVKQIGRLVRDAESRWKIRCSVVHRLGRLEIGEISVVVSVGAVHRADAFDACRWLMDTLKSTVPIWKKEFAEDGAYWVEGPDTVSSP